MKKTRDLVLCALFVALTALGAFLKIPLPGVPIVLQNLFTMLAGLLLGAKLGSLSVAVYIALGLMGLPIFTQGGGPAYILQPTFGYTIGFAIGAWVTGSMAQRLEKPTFPALLAANLAGLLLIYLFGTVHFYAISTFYLGKTITLGPLLMSCVVLCLPGDLLKCVLAALLARRLIPLARKGA